MYVEKIDYKGKISLQLLNLLLAEDEPAILQIANRVAEDTIKTTAGLLYNVTAELAKTGADRNYYLLNLAIDIALYNIYQRCDDEAIPEKIIKNHDDAIADLQKVSNGKQPLALTTIINNTTINNNNGSGGEIVPTGGVGLRRIGSQPKRSHNI